MLTRRELLVIGASATALAALPTFALANVDEAMATYTGGVTPLMEGVTITAPEIAENGNTVPVTIEAPGAVEIALFAAGNPTPNVGRFGFGAGSGAKMVGTRIRLGRTQDIIAIAKMEDGSMRMARVEVKVTIGGCGG